MKNLKTFKTIVEEFNYFKELRDSSGKTPEEIKELINDNDPFKRGYDLVKALFPVNPLKVKRKQLEPTVQEIEMLRKWISVYGSVYGSVYNSVWYSVHDSVLGTVHDSVHDSVYDLVLDSVYASDSVWDTVWPCVYAYMSSIFTDIKKWKGIDHKEGVNPFQPAIDLWERGLVASFDSETWRLHVGENAKIVYELEIIKENPQTARKDYYTRPIQKYSGEKFEVKDGFDVMDISDILGLSFKETNIFKYVLRAGRKDPETHDRDIDKAINYLNRMRKNGK